MIAFTAFFQNCSQPEKLSLTSIEGGNAANSIQVGGPTVTAISPSATYKAGCHNGPSLNGAPQWAILASTMNGNVKRNCPAGTQSSLIYGYLVDAKTQTLLPYSDMQPYSIKIFSSEQFDGTPNFSTGDQPGDVVYWNSQPVGIGENRVGFAYAPCVPLGGFHGSVAGLLDQANPTETEAFSLSQGGSVECNLSAPVDY